MNGTWDGGQKNESPQVAVSVYELVAVITHPGQIPLETIRKGLLQLHPLVQTPEGARAFVHGEPGLPGHSGMRWAASLFHHFIQREKAAPKLEPFVLLRGLMQFMADLAEGGGVAPRELAIKHWPDDDTGAPTGILDPVVSLLNLRAGVGEAAPPLRSETSMGYVNDILRLLIAVAKDDAAACASLLHLGAAQGLCLLAHTARELGSSSPDAALANVLAACVLLRQLAGERCPEPRVQSVFVRAGVVPATLVVVETAQGALDRRGGLLPDLRSRMIAKAAYAVLMLMHLLAAPPDSQPQPEPQTQLQPEPRSRSRTHVALAALAHESVRARVCTVLVRAMKLPPALNHPHSEQGTLARCASLAVASLASFDTRRAPDCCQLAAKLQSLGAVEAIGHILCQPAYENQLGEEVVVVYGAVMALEALVCPAVPRPELLEEAALHHRAVHALAQRKHTPQFETKLQGLLRCLASHPKSSSEGPSLSHTLCSKVTVTSSHISTYAVNIFARAPRLSHRAGMVRADDEQLRSTSEDHMEDIQHTRRRSTFIADNQESIGAGTIHNSTPTQSPHHRRNSMHSHNIQSLDDTQVYSHSELHRQHNTELHNTAVHNTEVHNTVVHNTKVHNAEMHNKQVHNTQVQNAQVHNVQVHNTQVHNAQEHNTGVHKKEVHNTQVHNAKEHNTGVHKKEVHNTVVHKKEVHNAQVHNTEVHTVPEKRSIPQKEPDLRRSRANEQVVQTHAAQSQIWDGPTPAARGGERAVLQAVPHSHSGRGSPRSRSSHRSSAASSHRTSRSSRRTTADVVNQHAALERSRQTLTIEADAQTEEVVEYPRTRREETRSDKGGGVAHGGSGASVTSASLTMSRATSTAHNYEPGIIERAPLLASQAPGPSGERMEVFGMSEMSLREGWVDSHRGRGTRLLRHHGVGGPGPTGPVQHEHTQRAQYNQHAQHTQHPHVYVQQQQYLQPHEQMEGPWDSALDMAPGGVGGMEGGAAYASVVEGVTRYDQVHQQTRSQGAMAQHQQDQQHRERPREDQNLQYAGGLDRYNVIYKKEETLAPIPVAAAAPSPFSPQISANGFAMQYDPTFEVCQDEDLERLADIPTRKSLTPPLAVRQDNAGQARAAYHEAVRYNAQFSAHQGRLEGDRSRPEDFVHGGAMCSENYEPQFEPAKPSGPSFLRRMVESVPMYLGARKERVRNEMCTQTTPRLDGGQPDQRNAQLMLDQSHHPSLPMPSSQPYSSPVLDPLSQAQQMPQRRIRIRNGSASTNGVPAAQTFRPTRVAGAFETNSHFRGYASDGNQMYRGEPASWYLRGAPRRLENQSYWAPIPTQPYEDGAVVPQRPARVHHTRGTSGGHPGPPLQIPHNEVFEGYHEGHAEGCSIVPFRPMAPQAPAGDGHRWDQYRDNHLQYARHQRHQQHQQYQRQQQLTYASSAASDWSDLDRHTPQSPVQGYMGDNHAAYNYSYHLSENRPRWQKFGNGDDSQYFTNERSTTIVHRNDEVSSTSGSVSDWLGFGFWFPGCASTSSTTKSSDDTGRTV